MNSDEYIINDCTRQFIVPEKIKTEAICKKDIINRFGVIEIMDDNLRKYPFIMSSRQLDIFIDVLYELKLKLE